MSPLGQFRFQKRGDIFVPTPPDPGGGGGPVEAGTFNLLVNESFSDSDRKLKDGTPFTSTMNQIYDGILNYYINGPPLTSVGDPQSQIEDLFAVGASYDVGRNGFRQYTPLTIFFRLTGDVRILDELCRLAKVAHDQGMRTTWLPDSGAWPGSGTSFEREPHGERFFASHLGGPADYYYGTDRHLSDTVRALRPFAEAAWAFRLNENVTSPGGHDFGVEADRWQDVFEGYERVWSSVADSSWPSNTEVPSTYRGYFRTDNPGSYRRAGLNEWPVNWRSGTHSAWGGAIVAYYMGKLIGKEAVGEAGLRFIAEPFLQDEVLYFNDLGTEHVIWGKRMEFADPDAENYAHDMVYAEFIFAELMTVFLDGVMQDDIDWNRMFEGVARSLCDYVIQGSLGDIDYFGDMSGGTTKSGTSLSGFNNTLGPSPHGLSNRAAWHNNGLLMPWDSTGKLRSWLVPEWESRWSSSFAQPRILGVPLGVFMDEAGVLPLLDT